MDKELTLEEKYALLENENKTLQNKLNTQYSLWEESNRQFVTLREKELVDEIQRLKLDIINMNSYKKLKEEFSKYRTQKEA